MGKLWFGGTIYTMQHEGETTEAVFTEKGKIVAVGAKSELEAAYRARISEQINLAGGFMYPGFTDSHLHLIGHGEKLLHLDLSDETNRQQALYRLKDRAEALEQGEWLIADGLNENQWEHPDLFTLEELDWVSADRPLFINRICRHMVLANSKALEAANITDATFDPAGGKIVRDKSGQATGQMLENAQELIKQAVPPVTKDDLKKVIDLSVKDLLRYGLVGGHTEDLHYHGGFDITYQAYDESINEDNMFRAHLLIHHEELHAYLESNQAFHNAFTELGAVKIFADGALGGRTAALTKSYKDDPANNGMLIHTDEDLEKLVKQARTHRLPVAVHAIGDAAILQVARTLKKYPPVTENRDRIIHSTVMSEDLYSELKELPVVLDVQPSFLTSDFPWVMERLGEERVKDSYSLRRFADEGIACAGGSDAPIESVNPLAGMEAAVRCVSSIDGKSYAQGRATSVFEAIRLYTKGSAFAINKEHVSGMILPEFYADFSVFDRDLFTIEDDKLTDANTEMTIVAEQIRYQRSVN